MNDEYIQNLRVHVTTTCTTNMLTKAKQNDIKLSEALRVGIGVLLAEKGDESYIGAVNIYRKVAKLREMLEDTTAKLHNLEK